MANSGIAEDKDTVIPRIVGVIFLLLSIFGLLCISLYALIAISDFPYRFYKDTSAEQMQLYAKLAAFFILYIFPTMGLAVWNLWDSFFLVKNADVTRIKPLLIKSAAAILLSAFYFMIIFVTEPW